MKFLVAFVAAIAMANAAVLVKDPLVAGTPLERTSIVGPSGTITQDKTLPIVAAGIAEQPLLKVAEPATVISEPVVPVVPAVKTVEPVAVPVAKVETVPTSVVSPLVASPLVTPVVGSQLINPVPLYKSVVPLINEYPYMPYDPYYFYQPQYIY